MTFALDEVVIIDVSHWQGDMNWDKAKPLIHAAYIKGTDGLTYLDSKFHQNKQALLERGIPFGVYHWLKPQYDVKTQVLRFISVIDGSQLIPYLDVEEKPITVTKNSMYLAVSKFLNLFMKMTGKEIGVYTRASFWDPAMPSCDIGKRHPLWVAHYNQWIKQPWLPRDWAERNETWEMWQWSADGNLRGAEFGAKSKSIDINRFNGGLAGFRKRYPNLVTSSLPGKDEIQKPEPPVVVQPPVIEEEDVQKLKVIVSGLNLRDKPSISGRYWFTMPKGTVVEAMEEVTDSGGNVWVRVGQRQYAAKVWQGNVYLA